MIYEHLNFVTIGCNCAQTSQCPLINGQASVCNNGVCVLDKTKFTTSTTLETTSLAIFDLTPSNNMQFIGGLSIEALAVCIVGGAVFVLIVLLFVNLCVCHRVKRNRDIAMIQQSSAIRNVINNVMIRYS